MAAQQPMRRLMLLRHAKSASPAGALDRDRPLAPRGRDAAPRIARYIAREALRPDLVLVSPARRTRETWEIVAGSAGSAQVRFEERLYAAHAEGILVLVQEIGEAVRRLLLVGHNPGFADLARLLSGTGEPEAMARLAQKFPTAALALIDVDASAWSEVGAGGGRLAGFVTPKTLGADADDD